MTLTHMSIVRRSIQAGAPESVAHLIATRLTRRALVPVEIHEDAAIDELIRPKKGAQP